MWWYYTYNHRSYKMSQVGSHYSLSLMFPFLLTHLFTLFYPFPYSMFPCHTINSWSHIVWELWLHISQCIPSKGQQNYQGLSLEISTTIAEMKDHLSKTPGDSTLFSYCHNNEVFSSLMVYSGLKEWHFFLDSLLILLLPCCENLLLTYWLYMA